MERRRVLGSVSTLVLAGCLTGNGIGDDDVEKVDGWILDGVRGIETAHRILSEWNANPSETDSGDMTWLSASLFDVRFEFDEEIAPIRDRVDGATIDRSYGGETWTVEGEQLASVLTELKSVVDAAHQLSTTIATVDGDPDGLTDTDRSLLETFFDDAFPVSEAALALWFRVDDREQASR